MRISRVQGKSIAALFKFSKVITKTLLITGAMALGAQYAAAISLSPSQTPLAISNSVAPMVMIDMSKDHSLFFRAYNDYTALDPSSSTIQTTYDNTIEYYGYFDSAKCYTYKGNSTTYGYFIPAALASSHYCAPNLGYWSGNFMNWASMTRIDAVRKLLYGGMRTTDTSSTTIISRAVTATDGHAFAKYYNGTDLPKLAPFNNPPNTTVIKSSTTVTLNPTRTSAVGNQTLNVPTYQFVVPGAPNGAKFNYNATSDIQMGDIIRAQSHSDPSAYVLGYVSSIQDNSFNSANTSLIGINVNPTDVPATLSSQKTYSDWDLSVVNQKDGGITFCSLSRTSDPTQSQIRVARGNYMLWAANEKYQCRWVEDVSNTQQAGTSNGNAPLTSGMNGASDNPIESVRALSSSPGTPVSAGEYFVNVIACDNSVLKNSTGAPAGSERCKQYPNGNYKPIGLLQVYGDSNLMQFGLITGSYSKNISGGVLRREMANFSDEIKTTTDGTFVPSSTLKGIAFNINQMRLPGFNYASSNYLYADQCTYELMGLVHSGGQNQGGYSQNEGYCVEWGNPVSEFYLESLRYFAGKQPTPAFLYDENSSINFDSKVLGMTQKQAWVDPLNNQNYCASLNVIVINSAYTSYDKDQMGGMSDLGSSQSVNYWTKLVGDGENITGNNFFIGDNGSGSTTRNFTCTAKTVSDFGAISGICPESPTHEGSYLIAGAAYYAHTNRIRNDISVIPVNDKKSLKVDTYGVQLASSTPKLSISVNGKTVILQPTYELDVINASQGLNAIGNGTLVDFKILSQTPTSGSFYANWEDSAQGGDYDQDTWGILSYTVTGNQISITTAAVSSTSSNGQGFGYVISGTDHDGTHFHSGANYFVYSDPNPITVTPSTHVNSTGGCKDCQPDNPPTTAVYTATGSTSNVLQDPLYYASKWGGFNTLLSSATPPKPNASDSTDNYFYVTNPSQLETALGNALAAIGKKSGFTTIAANSTSLQTASSIYQAVFNANNWTGQLYSFPLSVTSDISTSASWEAGSNISSVPTNNRVIITNDNLATATTGGIPFETGTLPAAYTAYFNINSVGVNDGRSADRIAWFRGDRSNEGTTTTTLRSRGSLLGDIVNSSPTYVGPPSSGYSGQDYRDFVSTYLHRKAMVYVGANDGMLHGFGATAGDEVFAFVPSAAIPNMAALTYQGYNHQYYVDGTPVVADAYINSTWRTLLVAGMNRGGKEIYALDVTDPAAIRENTAAQIVQWEFTDQQDSDLGYTYGRPAIVKMTNNRWAAVFGNGYNSAGGKAYLYIVFLDRSPGSKSWIQGKDYIKIATNSELGNGLSEPLPVDVLGTGTTSYVYAGDLNGNLWKFDLTSIDPANWGLASSTPLFTTPRTAGIVTQSITSSPDIIRNAKGGYVLIFGTGLYMQSTDIANHAMQSLYAIWDQSGVSTLPTQSFTVPISSLQRQSITDEVNLSSGVARVTSNNTVDYQTKRGWFMDLIEPDLTLTGERIVYNPLIYGGRIVFTTLIPSQIPCENGGNGYLVELDALTGARTAVTTLDVNRDGALSGVDKVTSNGQSVIASGLKTTGIPAGFTRLNGGSGTNKVYTGGVPSEAVTESSYGATGRLSWREVMQ